MSILTPEQDKLVHQLLESRTLDAATSIFRLTLGLDPDQVDAEAMSDMRAEIGKVFYPILGRLISGEPLGQQPARQLVESARVIDLRAFVVDVQSVPDLPQRLKDGAKRIEEYLNA